MRALLSSYVTGLILLVLVALVGFGVVRQIVQVQNQEKKIDNLEARVEQERQENENIRQDIASLEDDDRIEREARERLNLKKEGEHVVVIIPGDAPENVEESVVVTENEEETPSKGFVQTVFGWLGGIF